MAQPAVVGGRSLAEMATNAVNSVLYDMCRRSQLNPASPRVSYVHVGVFGYGMSATTGGEQAESVFGGLLGQQDLATIADLAAHPMETREIRKRPDLPSVPKPVWFDPVAGCGSPICDALALAQCSVAWWVRQHRSSFPPIVLNITSGSATHVECRPTDLDMAASRLVDEYTNDGHTLLFNIVLSSPDSADEAVWCPATAARLSEAEAALFRISSTLPDVMVNQARYAGGDVDSEGRGLVVNADTATLGRFLDMCTRVKLEQRRPPAR
jgi:hypothetical protein